MSTTPRLLKDLTARAEKENGAKEGNGNGKATNGAPKPLVVTKTPQGPRLTRAAAKVAKPAEKATKPAVKAVKAAKAPKAEEVKGPRVTKMDAAKRIFKAMAGKGRKEILIALQKDAKLTKAGAQTYYYLLLKKN